MKATRISAVLLLAALTAACSSLDNMVVRTGDYQSVLNSRDTALQQLQAASVCCGSNVANLQFKDLPAGFDQLITIDGSAQVFQFAEGRSYVAAYRLPQNSGDLKITLAAQIDKTVFQPQIMMLDSQFRVTRILKDDILSYLPAKLLDNDRMEGEFTVDRTYIGNPNNETYMVIYTPENKLNEITKTIHPAKLMAKSLAVVEPGGLKDPEIPHSPWGLVKLTVTDMAAKSGAVNVFKPAYQEAVQANTPKENPTPNLLKVTPSAAPAAQTTAVAVAAAAPAGKMMAETETMYNQMIVKAVLAGDLEKGMALAAEAERAGSTTAKTTLIQAIKSTQK